MAQKHPTVEELAEEAERFIQEFYEESDRAMALVGTAFLDDLTGSLLLAFFVEEHNVAGKLMEPDRPLGSFSSRIDVAYCVGLFTKEQRDDLHLIRKIRNEFAHVRHDITFNTVVIADMCRNLRAGAEILQEHDPNMEPKNRFWAAVGKLAAYMVSYGKYVTRQQYMFDMPLVWYEAIDEHFRAKRECK